jgi:hypothetical protein
VLETLTNTSSDYFEEDVAQVVNECTRGPLYMYLYRSPADIQAPDILLRYQVLNSIMAP